VPFVCVEVVDVAGGVIWEVRGVEEVAPCGRGVAVAGRGVAMTVEAASAE